MSSARAAFSRKRAPYSADWASSPRRRSSISSGSSRRSASGGGVAGSGEGMPVACAGRREDADAPVPDLVPEALDDDGAVGGDDTGCGLLIAEEREEVAGGK